jgi:hypothetical protein
MSASKNDEGAAAPSRDAAPSSQDRYVPSRGTMTGQQRGVNASPANLQTAVTPLNQNQDGEPAGMATQRSLWIATGKGNLGVIRQQGEMTWAEYVARQRSKYVPLPVTKSAYAALSGDAKAAIKRGLGFSLGAKYRAGARKGVDIEYRDTLNIDIDKQEPAAYEAVIARAQKLGCTFLHVGSASNEVNGRRSGRLIIPLSRSVTPKEFAAMSRKLAETLGIEYIDPISHQVNQICYDPARCSDASEVFIEHAGALLDADALLAQYGDWQDPKQWPRSSRELSVSGETAQLGDPCDKPGIIGAFCRAHDVLSAIEAFDLPYESTADERRWTPHGASSSGGARIYGHPKDPSAASWIFNSHTHGLSPQKNICAYDAVRLYRFGDRDKGLPDGTPVSELPSSRAMEEWIRTERPEVVAEAERAQFAELGFKNLAAAQPAAQPGAQSLAEAPKAEREPLPGTEQLVTSKRKPLVFIKVPRDILMVELPPQLFALFPWFPRSTVSLLAAAGGFGKTYWLLLAAVCKALGLGFCGPCTPGRVVFITGEDDEPELKRRLQKVLRYLVNTLGATIDWDLLEANFDIVDRVGMGAENMMVQALTKGFIPTDLPAFLAAQIGHAEWILLDTKSRFASSADENDNSAGSVFVAACELLAVRTSAAVTLLAHTGKLVAREGIIDQYVIRGASSLADDARSVMVLASPSDAQKKAYVFEDRALEDNAEFRMVHVKHNRSVKADDVFLRRQPGGVVAPFAPTRQQVMSAEERTWALLRYVGAAEIKSQQVKDRYKAIFGKEVPRNMALEIFESAISDGRLTYTRTYNRGDYYRLSDRARKELDERRTAEEAAFADFPGKDVPPESPSPKQARKSKPAAEPTPTAERPASITSRPADVSGSAEPVGPSSIPASTPAVPQPAPVAKADPRPRKAQKPRAPTAASSAQPAATPAPQLAVDSFDEVPATSAPPTNGNGAHVEPASEDARHDVDIGCRSEADADVLRKTVKDAGYSYSLVKLGCVARGVTQPQIKALLIPGRSVRHRRAAS